MRLIMIDEEVFTEPKAGFYDFLRLTGLLIIVVGKDLHHYEKVHVFKVKNRTVNAFYHTNKFTLRKPFKVYFAEKFKIDFEKVVVLSLTHKVMKNNILYTNFKDTKKAIMDFYGITTKQEKCSNCRGHGVIEEYDACGCPDTQYMCERCDGHGVYDVIQKV